MGVVIAGAAVFKSEGYDNAKFLEPPEAEPGEVISYDKFMKLREYALKVCVENRKLRKEIETLLKREVLDENFDDDFAEQP